MRGVLVWTMASVAVLVLAVCVIVTVFGNLLLNRYGRGKVERAFAEAHPGGALRIGELDYSMRANRMIASSSVETSTGASRC